MAKPIVDAEYLKEVEKARRDLRALISSKKCAPIMLRLAWHDAGTYDCKSKTGGPNGSIRNEEEFTHSANNGLKIALEFCEEVKAKHPKITYADLYQLAGVVAVEVTGGPTIDFVPGRRDSKISPREGRLPDAKQGLRIHLIDMHDLAELSFYLLTNISNIFLSCTSVFIPTKLKQSSRFIQQACSNQKWKNKRTPLQKRQKCNLKGKEGPKGNWSRKENGYLAEIPPNVTSERKEIVWMGGDWLSG